MWYLHKSWVVLKEILNLRMHIFLMPTRLAFFFFRGRRYLYFPRLLIPPLSLKSHLEQKQSFLCKEDARKPRQSTGYFVPRPPRLMPAQCPAPGSTASRRINTPSTLPLLGPCHSRCGSVESRIHAITQYELSHFQLLLFSLMSMVTALSYCCAVFHCLHVS